MRRAPIERVGLERWLLAAAAMGMLMGCPSKEAGGGYQLVVAFDSEALADRARSIVVSVVEDCEEQGAIGSAPVGELRSISLERGDLEPLGKLETGTLALYGRALDEDCVVVAAKCSEHQIERSGDGDLKLTLSMVSVGDPCVVGQRCDGKACVDVADEDILAMDDYDRTSAASWGAAPTGGDYSYESTQEPDFSVTDGIGLITMPTAAETHTAWIDSSSALDVELTASVSTDKAPPASTYGQVFGLIARRVKHVTEYRGQVHFLPDGSVGGVIVKLVEAEDWLQLETGKDEETIAGLTWAADRRFRVRFRVTGTDPTTARLRIWEDGQPEPSEWSLTRTDSEVQLQAEGAVGMSPYLSANGAPPVTFAVDDFAAVRR